MGIIRNFINIEGITPEEELKKNNNGHTIIYSDIETINIPINKPDIKNIYEISVNIDIMSHKEIHTPIGKLVILDGIKKFRIICNENSKFGKVSILNLELPFNTFTELPKSANGVFDVDIHIIDAYFSLIDIKKIYGYFLYLLDVKYENSNENDFLNSKQNSNKYVETYIKQQAKNDILEEISISGEVNQKELQDCLIDIDEEII